MISFYLFLNWENLGSIAQDQHLKIPIFSWWMYWQKLSPNTSINFKLVFLNVGLELYVIPRFSYNNFGMCWKQFPSFNEGKNCKIFSPETTSDSSQYTMMISNHQSIISLIFWGRSWLNLYLFIYIRQYYLQNFEIVYVFYITLPNNFW